MKHLYRTILTVLVLVSTSCIVAPVRRVTPLDGFFEQKKWGFNYDLNWSLLPNKVGMGCDLKTENFDHSTAKLLIDTSYVIDPSGQKRTIVVTWDYRAKEEDKCPWYRFCFRLDGKGATFRSGIYTMHLELKEKGNIYTYHGKWKVDVTLGTPL